MKYTLRQVVASVLTVTLLVPVTATAHEGHNHDTTSGSLDVVMNSQISQKEKDVRAELERRKAERTEKISDKREDAKQKLDTKKKQICERHQTKINNLITAMNKRRQHAFERITQVSDAVQSFATKKNLTSGTYEDAVAKVTAAKAAAESAMDTQQQATGLNCGGGHPRADMTAFKEKRLDSIDAMKVYRNAVKELVATVKQAAKDTRTPAQKGSEQ